MGDDPGGRVTHLLLAWSAGDESALTALLPIVYEELKVIAARHLRMERRAHTLQRTALVHEAFLRLVDQSRIDWRNRAQFFSLASQMMRRVLVDHARRRLSAKRGGGAERLSLDETRVQDEARAAEHLNALAVTADPRIDLGAIDGALKRLEEMDPRQGKLVELRFFGGLSIEEAADVLGISPATVNREWTSARAWLQTEIAAERPE